MHHLVFTHPELAPLIVATPSSAGPMSRGIGTALSFLRPTAANLRVYHYAFANLYNHQRSLQLSPHHFPVENYRYLLLSHGITLTSVSDLRSFNIPALI
jgi:hypothetical protein